jgi:hypothetical protein
MSKVVVTAQVEDPVKWEKNFRTHGSLFRSQPSPNLLVSRQSQAITSRSASNPMT